MRKNIETLKTYREIIIDIKTIYDIYSYNMRLKAEEYLDNQTNNKFNLYFDEVNNKKRNKVKILSLYR